MMEIKTPIFVTFANQYKLEDGTRGLTVNYFMLNEETGMIDVVNGPTEYPQGVQSAKLNKLSYEDKSKFLSVPGLYEGNFELTTGSDRKPALRLIDVTYLAPGNICVLDKEGKPAFPKTVMKK